LANSRKKGRGAPVEAVKRELKQRWICPRCRWTSRFKRNPLSENGADRLNFFCPSTPGKHRGRWRKFRPRRMSRISSPSRRNFSAKADIATLIFDAIDAGISGRAAQKVVAKQRALSSSVRRICVTHLHGGGVCRLSSADRKKVRPSHVHTGPRLTGWPPARACAYRVRRPTRTSPLKNAAHMLDMAHISSLEQNNLRQI
jgi:hypothetical protein